MGKPDAFLTTPRQTPSRRAVMVRLRDWREVYEPQSDDEIRDQASRCMDCGIPFCHQGCPLGNLIPEWNDLVYRGDFSLAIERLHATNNFPEFTGRLCPAPCESACVAGIGTDPVSIERTEYEIAEHAWSLGLVHAQPPSRESGRAVVIVGSGPAGLAAAQQLRRAGHRVTVLERAAEPGGLLRFGIPEFKMEKAVLDRRLAQLADEGVTFACNQSVGIDVSLTQLREQYDAVVLTLGSTIARELPVEGRDALGVYVAMDYLPGANVAARGGADAPIDVKDADVVIIGGGDTGADCLGTALRQGARSVTQLEILPEPPHLRPTSAPWPTMPILFKVTSAHEEGGQREYAVRTRGFLKDGSGRLRALELEPLTYDQSGNATAGDVFEIAAQFAFLAAGFVGPETRGFEDLPVGPKGTFLVDSQWQALPGESGLAPVYAAGDAARGQSLIVWAIAEGRSVAAAVDVALGGTSALPAPVTPGTVSW